MKVHVERRVSQYVTVSRNKLIASPIGSLFTSMSARSICDLWAVKIWRAKAGTITESKDFSISSMLVLGTSMGPSELRRSKRKLLKSFANSRQNWATSTVGAGISISLSEIKPMNVFGHKVSPVSPPAYHWIAIMSSCISAEPYKRSMSQSFDIAPNNLWFQECRS